MPGINVKLINAASAKTNPTSTGKWFCVQQSERGSTTAPILLASMTDFKTYLGSRVAYSIMWDAAEAFFEEGGSELIFGRVVGPAAVIAKVELEKAGGTKVLIVKAKNAGEWGNGLKVQVIAGEAEGTYRLKIFEGETAVEETKDLTTQLDAVTWSAGSSYVTITVGAAEGAPIVHAAVSLTGGTDDRAKIVTASYETALALLSPELGDGNVSIPGITASGAQEALEKHTEATNRSAIVDLIDSPTAATLISAASPLRSVVGARRSAAYAPWALIPGLAQEAPRTMPYSAIQAGIIARNDASATPPPVGHASAGDQGNPRYAIGLSQPGWSRAVREELNAASVNAVRIMPNGAIETYGNRTLVKPSVEPAWEQFSSARLYMYVWSRGEEILEGAEFKNIDNHNILFGNIEGKLVGMLMELGDEISNNPATSVNCGPSVNTKAVIAAKEVRAAIEIKPSQVIETAVLNISVGV
jgi:hypothetical protein